MTHASVFSGIGGPEVAATMLGWENLFHCEINPFGRQVLDYWYPNSKSYEDITTTDFTEWRGRVDVLTGGFPCQPFSYAGRRRGAEDDRYLWPSMYRAIDEIQPTWVVAENVAGILTMVEQGEVSKVAGSATLFDAFDDLRGRFELRALKVTDMPSSRCLFRLVPSEPPTDETGCSSSQGVLLQTPTNRVDEHGRRWTENAEASHSMGLSDLAHFDLLPTPFLKTPCTADSYTGNMKSKGISGTSGTLAQEVVNGFAESHRGLKIPKQSPESDDGPTSRLSPLFTEVWTALPFLSESGAPKPSKPTATPSSPK